MSRCKSILRRESFAGNPPEGLPKKVKCVLEAGHDAPPTCGHDLCDDNLHEGSYKVPRPFKKDMTQSICW